MRCEKVHPHPNPLPPAGEGKFYLARLPRLVKLGEGDLTKLSPLNLKNQILMFFVLLQPGNGVWANRDNFLLARADNLHHAFHQLSGDALAAQCFWSYYLRDRYNFVVLIQCVASNCNIMPNSQFKSL